MGNTNKHNKKLQTQVDKLSNLIKKNNDKIKDFQHRVKGLEEQNQHYTQHIQFLKDTMNLTTTILYNSGRDKKYVYGKVRWYSNLFEEGLKSKKKEFRYFLGKMDKKKPKYYWEDILLSKFYEKHKVSIDGIPIDSILNWEYDEDGKLLK